MQGNGITHEQLRELIQGESSIGIPSDLVDRMINIAERCSYKPKEPVIKYGTVNDNIYIVESGILELRYWNGVKVCTYGFALPGTLVTSPQSFYLKKPAFMTVRACRKATVLKITRKMFDQIMDDSHEFCKSMFYVAMGQLFASEKKLYVIGGTAKERYLSLLKNRQEIVQGVPMKTLASYLGITPSYLCHLKRALVKK